jgi:hypothetical protein
VKSYSVDKVNGVKSYGLEKFSAATDLGARQVSRLLDNQAGRALLTKVDVAIDLADTYVDKYLPEDDTYDSTADSSPQRKVKKIETDCRQQTVVVNKALELSYKVRRRAYNRVAKQLKTMKMRSLETVEKLHFNVNLIEYARNNFDSAKIKVYNMWDEIKKDTDQMSEDGTEHEHTHQNVTYERRAIATARHLTQRLKTSLSGFDLGLDKVPAFIRDQIDKAAAMAASLYQLLSSRARTGLTNEDIDSVKNSVEQLRTTLTSFDASATFKKLPAKATSVANAAKNTLTDVAQHASDSVEKTIDVANETVSGDHHKERREENIELREMHNQSDEEDNDEDDDDDVEEKDEQEALSEASDNEKHEDQKH